MAKQIYLMRHGETAWSITGQHTGRTDLPLTDNGERQALRLLGRLEGIAFTQVFTSPLQRARRTAELAGLGATARLDPELMEWNYGDYEGKTTAAIHGEQPGWNIFQHGCPHGETAEQIAQRADRVLARLRAMDGTVGLFSHGHFLRTLAVRWIQMPVQAGSHFALDTASISILACDSRCADLPVISLWNCPA